MSDETTTKNLLLEMGFPLQNIVQAMLSTGTHDIEQLVSWIEEHGESLNSNTDNNQTPAEKSMKCKECGKLFANEEFAAIHASKSGHADFEDSTETIKPLTEEEKARKVEELQKTIERKREEKAKAEEKEAIEREKLRIKQGKEFLSIKEKMRQQEMLKIAEERKREKMEEKLARQRIKEQIERDKLDRMKKFTYSESDHANLKDSIKLPDGHHTEHTLNGGSSTITSKSSHHNADFTQNSNNAVSENSAKTYDKCDLQIRLMDGTVLKHTFGANEQLAAVKLYIAMNSPSPTSLLSNSMGDETRVHNLDFGVSSSDFASKSDLNQFTLMTSFPKKVFSDDDMLKPLTELGLVPKAVVTVVRRRAA